MTDPTRPAVGLAVGATTLTAVTPDNSVTRSPVITLPNGVVIADFVDRVGDPVGIVASDGSVHHAETLLAESLRGLAYAATEGRPLPPATAITYPAHWRTGAVEALRRAIRQIPEWSADEPLLIPDTAAAVTALAANPGLPTRGVVALCDFGGSGTSITLVDGGQPIAPTVRHLDFSGDLIDQGLLAHVVAELSAGGALDVTGTSAIGSLTRLRAQCRAAKERLSTVTVTALPAELPNFRGDVRLTRTELDDVLARQLAEFVAVVRDALERSGVRPADLAAVASIGGGAAIPVITTTLSQHLRVPVITTPRPAFTGVIGAALRASRGPADDSATAMAPPVAPSAPIAPAEHAPASGVALAWSEAADVPDLSPLVEPVPVPSARPMMEFEPEPTDASRADDAAPAWYRRPLPVVAAALGVIVLAGAGTAVALTAGSDTAPVTPTPSITSTPQAAPAPAAPSSDPTAAPVQNQAVQQEPQAPAPRTVYQQAPAPVTQTQVVQAPPPPPPVTETQTTTVVTTEVSTPPPVTQTETATVEPSPSQPPQQPRYIPTIPPIPTIPGLPQIFIQPQSG
ncbi:Hsp70 family protein [Mycolicibacterium vinylchloridicum]|uniref:Hsp70 family protein n=1 Tax=Mycolicibacterium vinylchloridicum TaxID=2736928 RepID=UPI0015CC70B6|nr:Hsp70 family protein [Mycolicibacterium vinylchloridicum]